MDENVIQILLGLSPIALCVCAASGSNSGLMLSGFAEVNLRLSDADAKKAGGGAPQMQLRIDEDMYERLMSVSYYFKW